MASKLRGGESGSSINRFNRREFLTMGAGSLAAAAGVSISSEVMKEMQERPKEVARVARFLRGEAGEGESLKLGGREVGYEEFVKMVSSLTGPEKESPEVVKALLDAFADMIEVEDQFGAKFNKLELLEDIEPMVSKLTFGKVQTAKSFGFGQINPYTALAIARDKHKILNEQGLLSEKNLQRLNKDKLKSGEVVSALNLQKDENLVYSFLEFNRCYNFYGRNSRNQLNAEHRATPRVFALAVASYSANFLSPLRAKGQTYFNELMLSDPGLRDEMARELGLEPKALEGKNYLEVDGDMGKQTLAGFIALSKRLNIPEEEWPEEFKSPGKRISLKDIDKQFNNWLWHVRQSWHKNWENFFHKQEEKYQNKDSDFTDLARFVTGRYHTSTRAFVILREMSANLDQAASEAVEKRAREIFKGFVEQRQQGEHGKNFFNIIASPEVFAKNFPGLEHSEFIHEMLKSLPRLVTYDERFKGYVPMAYGEPRNFLANPKNIMERIIRAQDMDDTHNSRIGLYESTQERADK